MYYILGPFMKKVIRKAVTAGRWLVVVFALLSLTVSGADAGYRLLNAYGISPDKVETEVEHAQFLPGPPLPDEVPENMKPSGKPNGEPSAYISASLIIDSNPSQNRDSHDTDVLRSESADGSSHGFNSSIKSTANEVSSRLGVQFTLVGAKPSGTS